MPDVEVLGVAWVRDTLDEGVPGQFYFETRPEPTGAAAGQQLASGSAGKRSASVRERWVMTGRSG